MKNIVTLQTTRAAKQALAQEILDRADRENRPIDANETTLFDRAITEVKALDAEIEAVQQHTQRADSLTEITNRLETAGGRRSRADVPTVTVTDRIPAGYKRNGRLKAFKGPNAELHAYRSGMWARAMILGDQRAAIWCENNLPDFRNAVGGNSQLGGSVLVPEELSQTIIDLREEYGVFRREAYNHPMGSDTAIIPRRAGGVTVSFLGENPSAAPTESAPSWNNVRLSTKKLAGLVRMSTEVSEDAVIDIGDWIANEAAYAFATKEDQCGFIGDGSSTYGGIRGITDILKAGQSLAAAVDAASGHDTFAEIDATDLSSVMSVLPAYARANAKWYCSAVAFDLVFGRLMQAGGGNTISDLSAGYTPRYLGYPIVISQVLPVSTGDLSDVAMLLFGDLNLSSTLGSRRQISLITSQHRYMELDQIGIFFTERFDIVNHDVAGTSTVAGPMAALVGE